MAIGCHSNGSAHFEEKTLICQIIHETESSDQNFMKIEEVAWPMPP